MAALASTEKVVLGCIAFGIFWVLAVFPSVPFMPVGRTAGSLLGAMLMVLFRVMTPEQAYAAIDLPILGLLFGTMVVSIFLERADMFGYLGGALAWRSRGSKDLLFRVCLVSAVASALFTNDTCCVVLTEFILKLARQNNLPPQPFLLALASSSNIGSAATPIGNPQNLVIAVQSGITFGQFLVGVFPAMIVGVITNTCILLCYFWKYLSVPEKDQEGGAAAAGPEVVADDEVTSHRFTPARMSHASSVNGVDADCVSEPIRRSDSLNRADTHSVRSRSYNSEARHPGRHQVHARLQHVAGDGRGVHRRRQARRRPSGPQEDHQDHQPPAERHHRGRARGRRQGRREGQGRWRGEGEEVEGAPVEDFCVPHDPWHARRPAHGAQHVLVRHHCCSRTPGTRFH